MTYIEPRQRLRLITIRRALSDIFDEEFLRFVWELPNEVTQAAGKHMVRVRPCTSLHHQTLLISVVDSYLGGKIVGVEWERFRPQGGHDVV